MKLLEKYMKMYKIEEKKSKKGIKKSLIIWNRSRENHISIKIFQTDGHFVVIDGF